MTANKSKRSRAPAKTPVSRENQLISLAVDLAETQLKEGTASSQVITHFLKLGSTREDLEKEKLKKENELLKAKAEAISGEKALEKLYQDALMAMRSYSGYDDED